jgi:transcriptional regulator with XRE-family HTH domain
MSIFACNLEETIDEIGITQAALAEKAGLTPSAISQFISGDREPSLSSLLQICYALQTTPNDLLSFHSEEHIQLRNEICRLREKINRVRTIVRENAENG